MKGYEVIYRTYHNEYGKDGREWVIPQTLETCREDQLTPEWRKSRMKGYARYALQTLVKENGTKNHPVPHSRDEVHVLQYDINPLTEAWHTPVLVDSCRYTPENSADPFGGFAPDKK